MIVWVNTVGPYNNRQETYPYYGLPFCKGSEVVEHHHETLGEVLQGLELINAGIGPKFRSIDFLFFLELEITLRLISLFRKS